MFDSVPIGSVLLGKYRVDGVIGEGGMGVVLRAYHLQLRECVALKFPKRETLRWPGAAARFLSEARAAIRIKSEHVARVVDVGTLSDDTPFIVMEYLEGETLSQYAVREAPIDVHAIVEFVTQISEAIAEAHALGIVHRDLKPANIILTRRADGILAAKVLDFGISKVTDAAWEDINSREDIDTALGSPAYASPEQLQSPNQVDARSDIWSLGVIMYELATGRLPFSADTTVALCGRVLFDPFVPLRGLRPDLPSELCETIHRCLEKRPEHRHASVGHLVLELLPFATNRARASIERIARTLEVGAEIGPTLTPIVSHTEAVFTRGVRAALVALSLGWKSRLGWVGALALALVVVVQARVAATSTEHAVASTNRALSPVSTATVRNQNAQISPATIAASNRRVAAGAESLAQPSASIAYGREAPAAVPPSLAKAGGRPIKSTVRARPKSSGAQHAPESERYLDDPAYANRD